ncbi:hypothetical protein FAGKG844_180041 [Frankia sp. AgKG'84/4]
MTVVSAPEVADADDVSPELSLPHAAITGAAASSAPPPNIPRSSVRLLAMESSADMMVLSRRERTG